MSALTLCSNLETLLPELDTLVVVARAADLAGGWVTRGLDATTADFAARLGTEARPGSGALTSSLLPAGGAARRLKVVSLYDSVSRHLSPTGSYEISTALKGNLGGNGTVGVIIGLREPGFARAAIAAVARAMPQYDRKTSDSGAPDVRVLLRTPGAELHDAGGTLQFAADTIRTVCRLVDMPPAELDTTRFENEARDAAKDLDHVTVTSIVGDDLLRAGLRGLHAVGRTAMEPPRLVLLDYNPPEARETIALIGKGLVYDTGGLSLKIVGDRMLTMKCDMGGAAAVLGAFLMLARGGVPLRVVAGLGMAENAIGPNAYRPDDVIEMHSGKTVEINNTDAEGRLALADAASYVARTYAPTTLIDAATLTGAQLIATGKGHAGIVSNRVELERLALDAGLQSGDHCLPMLWSPELMRPEFKSKVADMRNSVADRMNAQSAAAGFFVWSHIEDLDLDWLHIDLAGPSFIDNRATGYGAGLIAAVVASFAE